MYVYIKLHIHMKETFEEPGEECNPTQENANENGEDKVETANATIPKLDALVLDMCYLLYNLGMTVNMNNYYTSVSSAMKLLDNGVFCQGTVQTNRKLLPKSVPLQSQKFAT